MLGVLDYVVFMTVDCSESVHRMPLDVFVFEFT